MSYSDTTVSISSIPSHLSWIEREWLLEWILTADTSFMDPFFDQSLHKAKCDFIENRNRQRKCFSTAEFLIEQCITPKPPALLIFHISRCGSTLVSQLIAQLGGYTCFSEMPLLDEILSSKASNLHENLTKLLIAAVNYLTRSNTQAVIKTDSWHIFHQDIYTACFPNTPILLLYRHPHEVWLSHKKEPGLHVIPGLLTPAQLNGAMLDLSTDTPLDIYFSELMTRYMQKMINIKNAHPNCILVNLNEGADNMMSRILKQLQISLTEEELSSVKTRAQYHSKNPQASFINPITQPHEAPDFLSNAMRYYWELERLREKQIS